MFIVTDLENQMTVGPFVAAEDAARFISKVEDMSRQQVTGFEILQIDDPEEWLYENMDDLLMSSC